MLRSRQGPLMISALLFSAWFHVLLLWGLGSVTSATGTAPSAPPAAAALQVRLQHPSDVRTGVEDVIPPTVDRKVQHADAAGNAGSGPTGPALEAMTAIDPYYRASELDVRPQIKVHVMPQYPEHAEMLNAQGKVVLALYISRTGDVDRVEVIRAEPRGMFEESATGAFLAARFTAGLKNGQAVKSLLMLEVTYGSPVSEMTGAAGNAGA